jgi:hypothetical protein
MNDITERLRDPKAMQKWWDQYGMDAANEIERLRAALLAAWETYIADQYGPLQCDCDPSVGINGCLVCEIRDLVDTRQEESL